MTLHHVFLHQLNCNFHGYLEATNAPQWFIQRYIVIPGTGHLEHFDFKLCIQKTKNLILMLLSKQVLCHFYFFS